MIDTINISTTFSSLNVSGASTSNSIVTLLSSLNMVCSNIGSGTALTNLNYNAIPHRPDLSGYRMAGLRDVY
jgi:hypothetical protein